MGDTVRFMVPATDLIHTPARLIRWSSDNPVVAAISTQVERVQDWIAAQLAGAPFLKR
jgi:hypothetical protein